MAACFEGMESCRVPDCASYCSTFVIGLRSILSVVIGGHPGGVTKEPPPKNFCAQAQGSDK